MSRFAAAIIMISVASAPARAGDGGAPPDAVGQALQKGQWNEAIQVAQELLDRDPRRSDIRVQQAYALFQRGFSNAALLVLSKISADDWKRLPEGRDRLSEVVLLFEKKVPLNLLPGRLAQADPSEASPYLRDEIRFARGREAFEKGDRAAARASLEAIPATSRLSAKARYLLGAMAVQTGDAAAAAAAFSKVFEPTVFAQSTEVWRDMGAQMTSHWGTNLKVMIDGEAIADNTTAGELAILGLARLAYASRNYETALADYDKIAPGSPRRPRATLEKIWTLLGLNRHEEAQKAALALSADESSFESVEAMTLRALVLADAGRTDESRAQLDAFFKVYGASRDALRKYDAATGTASLPAFIRNDLKEDNRIGSLASYDASLKNEIKALRAEDQSLFPAEGKLAAALDPLVGQAEELTARFIVEHVGKRSRELDALNLQARLIIVETYLEDREKLRAQFRELGAAATADKQLEHDEKLADLLARTVKGVDEIVTSGTAGASDPRLQFRQSELLWELSTARSILSQVKGDGKEQALADELRERSLKIAQDIVRNYPRFDKRPQAMFFSGYALTTLNRLAEGAATLEQYVKSYPQHPHVPDAYRILADLRFDENDFNGAEKLYRKVLETPDSPIVGYALYKIGWCAYNLKDFGRALLGLEKAVVWAGKSSQSGHPDQESRVLSLRREARHDLVTLYAEFGDHHKAEQYFSRFLDDDPRSWLVELTRELDRIGQFEKSGDLYRLLILKDPDSKDDISFQAAIVHGYQQLHRWPQAIEAMRELVDRYRGALASYDGKNEAAVEAEKIAREAVLAQHFEYAKRPGPDAAERVGQLDELYLSAFRAWPTAEEPIYRYANFLLDQRKTKQAAEMFLAHWTQYNASLKEPLREESLRNLIHALDQQEQEADQARARQLKDKAAPAAVADAAPSASGQSLIELSSLYEKDYASTKYARPIAFLRPAMLFKYGRAAEGVVECQKLFDLNPVDDVGKRCFANLRVAYYDRKDWESTYRWADELAERKTAGMNAYRDDLKSIREESLFLWAQNEPDDAKSAALFKKIAAVPDMQRLRDKSLYNAFIRTQKAGRTVEALGLADELQQTAPKYEGLASISGVRASTYQQAGDYGRALPLLEEFLASPEKDTTPASLEQARLNAALIAEALGREELARARYAEVLKTAVGGGPAAKEAQRGLERLDHGAVRRTPAAFPRWAALLKAKSEYERHPLAKGSDLVRRIQAGGAALESVTKSFLDAATAASTPTDFAFEAYCAVPLLYEAYSHAVLAIADAKELKPKEAEELRPELQKIAAPIDFKARELADQCLSKGAEAEHQGQFYSEVAARWGWQTDAAQKTKAGRILALLESKAPWLDASKLAEKESESQLVKAQLEGGGTLDSWYALALLRLRDKRPGLARLTIVDALARSPDAGQLLNALAVVESPTAEHPSGMYERAGEKGSAAAWANLALYHLKGARLAQTISALKHCLDSGSFTDDGELKDLAKEFLGK